MNIQHVFFSIIIPCYNCQNTIIKTINSIICQSFNSIEIILIDDCSSDNTYEILKSINESSHNIKLIRNEINQGPGNSRNIGLNNAIGKYVCFLDSDDAFASNFFDTLYSHIINTDSDLILFDYDRCFQNGSSQTFNITNIFSSNTTKKEYIALSGESVWSLTAKRDLFSKIRFPNTFLAEDVVIVPILCSLAHKITTLHFVGYHYTYNSDSLSRSPNPRMPESIIESCKILDKYYQSEYQIEFTFRKIRLICYNYVYIANRLKIPTRIISKTLSNLMKDCPNWGDNIYIQYLPNRKRIFIKLVKYKAFKILKLYVKCQELFFFLNRKI